MTSSDMEERKSGISRRDLIKKGAVAGAVFWSVPVIESITSRAAAVSGCVTFNASWIYVVYTYNGTTYFSGFSKGDTAGACTGASNPHGDFTIQCGSTYYTIHNFSGDPTGQITYGPTSPGTNVATYMGPTGSPNCNTFVSINGGEVYPVKSGVTIVAAFCFGAGNLGGACPDSNSTCANCE